MVAPPYELSEQRARQIVNPVLEDLAMTANEIVRTYRLPRALGREFYRLAAEATVIALYELPDSVLAWVGNKTIRNLIHLVGWAVMYDALEAVICRFDPPGTATGR